MRHLRTEAFGSFPLAAALSLFVLIPCAAALQMAGAITTAGSAVAAGAVGVGGVYAVMNLLAWGAAFLAERSIMTLGSVASSHAEDI